MAVPALSSRGTTAAQLGILGPAGNKADHTIVPVQVTQDHPIPAPDTSSLLPKTSGTRLPGELLSPQSQ